MTRSRIADAALIGKVADALREAPWPSVRLNRERADGRLYEIVVLTKGGDDARVIGAFADPVEADERRDGLEWDFRACAALEAAGFSLLAGEAAPPTVRDDALRQALGLLEGLCCAACRQQGVEMASACCRDEDCAAAWSGVVADEVKAAIEAVQAALDLPPELPWRPFSEAKADGFGVLAFGIHTTDNGKRWRKGDFWYGIIQFDIWRGTQKWVFAKDGSYLWSRPLLFVDLTPPRPELRRAASDAPSASGASRSP